MNCKSKLFVSRVGCSGLLLVCALCTSAVHAQGVSGFAGDLSYTRGSGSGGYSSNSLAVNLEPTTFPLWLTLNLIQSLVDNNEVSGHAGVSAGWRVSPMWSVSAHVSTASDALLNVTGTGLSVAWNLNKLWQSKLATQLELEQMVFDYSVQDAAAAQIGRMPQQRRTKLGFRQGLSDAVEVHLGVEAYDYSRDPVDLARALLTRKIRRVAAAGMLGDLADRGYSAGLNWTLAQAWGLDLSIGSTNTVLGQTERQKAVGLTYLLHPRTSVSLTWSDSSSNALRGPTGLTVAPAQSDSIVDLGVQWLF